MKRGRRNVSGDHPLRFVIENHARNQGVGFSVCPMAAKGQVTLKVIGIRYAFFTFNKEGVVLYVRDDILNDICIPKHLKTKSAHGTFGTKIYFVDSDGIKADSSENILLIVSLLNASIYYVLRKEEEKELRKLLPKDME